MSIERTLSRGGVLSHGSRPLRCCSGERSHRIAVCRRAVPQRGDVLLLSPQRRECAAAANEMSRDNVERDGKETPLSVRLRVYRRETMVALTTLFVSTGNVASMNVAVFPSLASAAMDADQEEQEEGRYDVIRDDALGFSFLKPDGWLLKSKAGADVLFQKGDIPSTTAGIVIQPVKGVSSLDEFGSLDVVTERVLATEANKDGFYAIKLIEKSSSMKRPHKENDGMTREQGVTFYTIDYEVSTSRGDKRIISSVAIHNRKLYIFNITAKPVKYSDDQWLNEERQLKLMAESFVVF